MEVMDNDWNWSVGTGVSCGAMLPNSLVGILDTDHREEEEEEEVENEDKFDFDDFSENDCEWRPNNCHIDAQERFMHGSS